MEKKIKANGKNHSGSVRPLHEILGEKERNEFGVESLSQLEEKIRYMNLTDLQKLAIKVGLIPVPDRNLLKRRIVAQWKKRGDKYCFPKQIEDASNRTPKISKAGRSILSQGS